jgi:glycosyltransferase involved in cell wall biosynthesis
MGERRQCLLALLTEAAEKYKESGILDMNYCLEDRGKENMYSMSYSRINIKTLCGPDWTCHAWPSANISSFKEETRKISEVGNIPAILHKVGWYGNIHSAYGCIEEKTRPLLKKMGDQHPDHMDIVHVQPRHGHIGPTSAHYLSLMEMVARYEILLDIGGNGYSGRLKYLLFSNRPILLVEREEVEYFHHDLVPWKHYIPVKQDLTDLMEKVQWVFSHPIERNQIAENARQFANQYLTREQFLDRIYIVYKNYQQLLYPPKSLLFSIIIPTHKRFEKLQRAVQSVVSQSYTYKQIIVVSDCYDEDTIKICTMLGKDDLFIIQKDAKGPSESRNIGIENARGDVILFLDDNDRYEVDYLEKIHCEMTKVSYDKNEILYFNYEIVFNKDYEKREIRDIEKIPFNYIFVKNFIDLIAIVFPIHIIKNKKFDTEILYADWEFILQTSMGNKIRHVPICGGVKYENKDQCQLNSIENMVASYQKIYLKYNQVCDVIQCLRNELLPNHNQNKIVNYQQKYEKIASLIANYKTVCMVIAKYNESLEWLPACKSKKTLVYNKGSAISNDDRWTIIQLPNVGRESHTYLWHIINNYDSLDEWTLFLQGYPFDHISSHNDVQEKNGEGFMWVSSFYKLHIKSYNCALHPSLPIRETLMHLYDGKEKEEWKQGWDFEPGGQFMVHRDRIRLHPVLFYQKALALVDKDSNPIFGYVMERLWGVIFSSSSIIRSLPSIPLDRRHIG